MKGHLQHCGRVISVEELADIRERVATCSRLSRSELALTIAEHLERYSESGFLKPDACLNLLEKLEVQGVLKLPEKQISETFVDPERYTVTCYRASNWLYVGDTTGTGLARQGKSYTSSPKKIFVLSLVPDFRTVLSSNGGTLP
jgi:hypothetical protein